MQREYFLTDLVDLVKANNLEAIKKILERYREWFRIFSKARDLFELAVKEAVLSGNVEAARILLDAGIREYHLSDLVDLVKANNLEAIKKTLERDRTWLSAFSESREKVDFAVKEAILSGNVEAAKIFFDAGISVNSWAYEFTDKKRRTFIPFLKCAVLSGKLDMVKLLVERGVRLKSNNANQFPEEAVRIVIKRGDSVIADYLFEHGANTEPRCQIYYIQAVIQENHALIDVLFRRSEKNSVCRAIDQYYSDYINYPDNSLEKYEKIIRGLMDYASGGKIFDLEFLKLLPSVAGINLIDISMYYDDKLVTPAMLKALNLKGVDEAIFTPADLEKIQNIERREALRARVTALLDTKTRVPLENEQSLQNLTDSVKVVEKTKIQKLSLVSLGVFGGTSSDNATSAPSEMKFGK